MGGEKIMLKDKASRVVIHTNHGISLSSLSTRRLWPASRTGHLLPDACITVPVRTLGGPTRKSVTFRYFRLPTLFWDVTQHSLAVTDVSGKPVVPVQRTDMLSRNVGNYQPTMRNIPEERRSHS